MDTLYVYYVLQTDSMLPKWLGELDGRSNSFLNTTTISTMGSIANAGESESENESDNESNDGGDDSSEDYSDDDSTANVDDMK